MSKSAENPLGLNGFAFVEFTSPQPDEMARTFELLGFTAIAKHPKKNVIRYRQGQSNLLLNQEEIGHAAEFRKAHGPSAAGMAFRVADAKEAFEHAVSKGAKPTDAAPGALGEGYALEGIGGSMLYLVDKQGEDLWADWEPIPGAEEAEKKNSVGLEILDHLTHNVHRGQMRVWSEFYSRVFGFEEQKFFNIDGQATGLVSQAMIAPDRKIRIPLNESKDDKSQIEEYLKRYNGEGIQHLAFTTENIYETVEKMRERGVRLQDTIETYYELVDKRVGDHDEDLERLKKNRILIDGNREEGFLLQIFTEDLFGPIFFEIIQRKGNEGFGNGNFQALFESIELDQIRRGVLKVD